MKYTWRLDNRLNQYTIYKDGKDMKPEEVINELSRKHEQPSHYTTNGTSPLDCFKEGLISEDELVGFCKGNIIKYIVRAGLKGNEPPTHDYSKAMDYLNVLLELSRQKENRKV